MSPGADRGRDDAYRTDASGNADAIQKTTYVTGEGTDPDEMTPPGVVARVPPGRGANPLLWAVIAVAIIVALVYGLGLGLFV